MPAVSVYGVSGPYVLIGDYIRAICIDYMVCSPVFNLEKKRGTTPMLFTHTSAKERVSEREGMRDKEREKERERERKRERVRAIQNGSFPRQIVDSGQVALTNTNKR